MNMKKIINFLYKMDEMEKGYLSLALASFFVEGLFPEEYTLEDETLDLNEVYSKIPEDFMSALYPCALEFFFSNEYRGEEEGERWNVVDVFLKKKGILLSPSEKEYLKGLRSSYMGLYEIKDIEPDKSLTLKSLIKQDPCEIVLREKLGTRQLVKWDLIGGRIVQTKKGAVLAGGILVLSREAAKEAKESIEYLSSLMLSREFLEHVKEEEPEPELMVRKMWVKEIAGSWFKDNLRKKAPPVLLNMDGEDLQYVTLMFPLAVSKKEISERLNSLSELVQDSSSHWIWFSKVSKKTQKRNKEENTLRVATQMINIEDGKTCSIYASLKIKGKNLVIEVNSQERASILKNFLGLHLRGKLGDPSTKVVLPSSLTSRTPDRKSRSKTGLSPEEEASLLKEFQTHYYQQWLDSPLPALNNKTPRKAVKTASGKEQIIDLVKDMKSSEERKAKRDQNGKSSSLYNFDWILRELGIQEEF